MCMQLYPRVYKPARTVDEGQYLTVHWLRTDPSGLVKPLTPPIGLTTPQASSHASECPNET